MTVKKQVKKGIDFFPLNVAMNEAVELVEAQFGLIGFGVIIKLYQRIYQRGFYCEWTPDVAMVVARKLGISSAKLTQVVEAAVRRGVFDQTLFEQAQILTSKGIQKRYLDVVSKRKCKELETKYLLVELPVGMQAAEPEKRDEPPQKRDAPPPIRDGAPQRKEKERKEKKTIEEERREDNTKTKNPCEGGEGDCGGSRRGSGLASGMGNEGEGVPAQIEAVCRQADMPLSELDRSRVRTLLTTYTPGEIVTAVQKAAEQGRDKLKWAYILGILKKGGGTNDGSGKNGRAAAQWQDHGSDGARAQGAGYKLESTRI